MIDFQFFFSDEVVLLVREGLAVTLRITLVSSAGALVLGLVSALGQLAARKGIRLVSQTYVTVFRNIPLLVVLFFFYFGLPVLISPRDAPFIYGSGYEERVVGLVIALVVGAYVSEVIRGGVEAISIGQLEAALATGMTRKQAFTSIIFPQVLPVILPGLTNEAITVVKDTAFAVAVGAKDLMSQAQQIEAMTFKGFEAMTIVTVIYLALISAIYVAMMGLERVFRREVADASQ